MHSRLHPCLLGLTGGLLFAGPGWAVVIEGVEVGDPSHIELEVTLSESVVSPSAPELRGYGTVLRINGVQPTGPGAELTLVFEDYFVSGIAGGGTNIAFSGGTVRLYLDDTPDFAGDPSLETAGDGDLWLELAGLAFTDGGTGLTGTLISTGTGLDTATPSGTGEGRLEVVGGLAAEAFATYTDFSFTSEFQLDPSPADPAFPLTGTATITATLQPVPEPATLGILGMGLLGMGLLRRRR